MKDLAVNLGHVARGHKKWLDDGGKALHKYVAHLKTHKAYFEPSKRGRKPLLTKVEMTGCKPLEFRRSNFITSTKALAIAVGIMSHHRPKAAAALDGHLSTEWEHASQRLHRASRNYGQDVQFKRDSRWVAFFALLAPFGINPSLVYNMDEFFVVLDSESATWTWTRVTAEQSRAYFST